jgi:hypothetical protein
MTLSDFKTNLNVPAVERCKRGPLGACEFERSRAEKRQKIREEERLDELRRAHPCRA